MFVIIYMYPEWVASVMIFPNLYWYPENGGTLSWISLLLLAGAYEVGGVDGSLSLPCTMKVMALCFVSNG